VKYDRQQQARLHVDQRQWEMMHVSDNSVNIIIIVQQQQQQQHWQCVRTRTGAVFGNGEHILSGVE